MSYDIVKESQITKDGKIKVSTASNNVTPKTYYTSELRYTVKDILENDESAEKMVRLITSGEFKFNSNAKGYLHLVFIKIDKLVKELDMDSMEFYEKEHSEEFKKNLAIVVKELRNLLQDEELKESSQRKGYLKFKLREDEDDFYVTKIRTKKGYLEDFEYTRNKRNAEPNFTIAQKETLEVHYSRYKFEMEYDD